MADRCPVCGEVALEHRQGDYVFHWPTEVSDEATSVFPHSEWAECTACGEKVLSEALDQRIEQEQYRVQGLLCPAEVREIRERTGLSQLQMARLLGIGDKTYARWEAGLTVQNKSTDNLIRLAADHPELFAELEAQRDPKRKEETARYIKLLPSLKPANRYALAAHGELPQGDAVEIIHKRLQALLRQRERDDGAAT